MEAVNHDALLQASRRVDWRFLLPDPDLGRVAYIGATDRGLVESLGLFSAELTVLRSAVAANGRAAPYDLVVLRDPGSDELERACSLLSPRGSVYVEVDSPLRRMQGLASRSASGYARALRQLGFVDVEAHMHWPDFDSCRAIVRLDDAVAVRQAMARGRRGGRARLVTRLGPALASTRQLALFVPCASVLGRRAPSPDTVIR